MPTMTETKPKWTTIQTTTDRRLALQVRDGIRAGGSDARVMRYTGTYTQPGRGIAAFVEYIIQVH